MALPGLKKCGLVNRAEHLLFHTAARGFDGRYVHRTRTPAVPPKIVGVYGHRGLFLMHRLDAKFVEFCLQISGLLH
jgi:hypothetical protein